MMGKTMWYLYNQNNSGGGFDYNEHAGISVNVWVEADSPRVADARAQDIGLYFDGYGDCDCCGDRWYSAYDATDENPPAKDEPFVKDEMSSWGCKWVDGYETFVHPLEGSFYGAHKEVTVVNPLVYGGENGYGVAIWKDSVRGPYAVSQKGWDESGNLDAPHPKKGSSFSHDSLHTFKSGVRFSYNGEHGYGRAWFSDVNEAGKLVVAVNHYLDTVPRPNAVQFVLGNDERMTGPLK